MAERRNIASKMADNVFPPDIRKTERAHSAGQFSRVYRPHSRVLNFET